MKTKPEETKKNEDTIEFKPDKEDEMLTMTCRPNRIFVKIKEDKKVVIKKKYYFESIKDAADNMADGYVKNVLNRLISPHGVDNE
jgi:hypothetical protein